ncbi:AtpZ/AtpI family protein [Rubrolithibacter danxiaensis]|uniref:AtpZ/AtpI family protein n=1 Tax=Rubrolithibacter danxiaensis TaxID=3390805 RepID=UPI003BF8D26A
MIKLHFTYLYQMPDDKNKPVKKGGGAFNNYIRYSAAGFQMIVIIGVFTFIGYKIDENRSSETPLFTAGFSLLGVFIALYQVIRSISNNKS